MGETPIFGIPRSGTTTDPFGPLRVIFASQRGTLVELGIGPIVTAGLILQVLSGSKMINVDFTNPQDRALFTGASKVLSIVMTIFEGIAFLVGGAYNAGGQAPSINADFLIIIQLVFAGIIIILLDEMLQKNWGFGSGISLFIAAGVCQSIVWDAIGPISPVSDQKYLGAILAFIQALLAPGAPSKLLSLSGDNPLVRPGNLPDMLGFLVTIIVLVIIVYLNGLRVEVPVSYARYRGYRGQFPIKLFYVSNIPVIFAAALFGNIYFIGQLVFNRYNSGCNNFWLGLIPGCYTTEPNSQQLIPTKGLAYYTFAPRQLGGLSGVFSDPVRAVVYLVIFVATCVFFAVTWVEVGGMDSKTVAKQLIDSGMQVEGFRRSGVPIRQILDRYIPTVTVLGGIIIGFIAAGADFLGAFGTGTGILLTVGIIEQYYEILVKERITEIYPGVKSFLGT